MSRVVVRCKMAFRYGITMGCKGSEVRILSPRPMSRSSRWHNGGRESRVPLNQQGFARERT